MRSVIRAMRPLVAFRASESKALAAVSFWREFAEEESLDELIRTSKRRLALVFLPTNLVFGNCERDLVPPA